MMYQSPVAPIMKKNFISLVFLGSHSLIFPTLFIIIGKNVKKQDGYCFKLVYTMFSTRTLASFNKLTDFFFHILDLVVDRENHILKIQQKIRHVFCGSKKMS